MFMRQASTFVTILVVCTVFLIPFLAGANAQLGGGVIRGRIWGYTWLDEAVPLVWAKVSAYMDGQLVGEVSTGSSGSYVMYLPRGNINVTVDYPGFLVQSKIVSISEGGTMSMDWYLEKSGLPIPELSLYNLLPVVALLIAFCQLLVRRKK